MYKSRTFSSLTVKCTIERITRENVVGIIAEILKPVSELQSVQPSIILLNTGQIDPLLYRRLLQTEIF